MSKKDIPKIYDSYPIAFASVKDEKIICKDIILKKLKFTSGRSVNLSFCKTRDELIELLKPCWEKNTFKKNPLIIPIDTLYRINVVYQIMQKFGIHIKIRDDGSIITPYTWEVENDIDTNYYNEGTDIFQAFNICVEGHVNDLIQDIKTRCEINENLKLYFDKVKKLHHNVTKSFSSLTELYSNLRYLIIKRRKPINYDKPYDYFVRSNYYKSDDWQNIIGVAPKGMEEEDFKKIIKHPSILSSFDFEKVEDYYKAEKLKEKQQIKICSICGNLFYADSLSKGSYNYCGVHKGGWGSAEARAFRRKMGK